MHTGSRASQTAGDSRLERAIVLQLLREGRDQSWSHAELAAELDAAAPALERALRSLEAEGVVCLAEERVWASRASRRLDELQLIGI